MIISSIYPFIHLTNTVFSHEFGKRTHARAFQLFIMSDSNKILLMNGYIFVSSSPIAHRPSPIDIRVYLFNTIKRNTAQFVFFPYNVWHTRGIIAGLKLTKLTEFKTEFHSLVPMYSHRYMCISISVHTTLDDWIQKIQEIQKTQQFLSLDGLPAPNHIDHETI